VDSAGSVSVVIPNFDRGHLLADSVSSALAQEVTDLEVLVCDDGSGDDSEAVVRGFSHPRVRWLPGPRSGGPAGPRNRGIAEARGDWVAFLDSDDVWLPGKLSVQLAAMADQGVRACTTNAYRYLPGSDQPADVMHVGLPASIGLDRMLRANLVITSAMVVSTELLRRVGGFPEAPAMTIFEDYACWLRVAQLTDIAVVDRPLVQYRDEAATSIRAGMRLERSCTQSALRDFRRWRAAQHPPISTRPAERLAMGRQVASLVSVRQVAAHATHRLTGTSR
jgi:glycosyltransferase involved in cell wall biosynthesis